MGARINMMLNKCAVIHPVELIAGQNQVMINIPFLKQPLVFANSISGALKPAGAIRGLLSCKNLDESLAKPC